MGARVALWHEVGAGIIVEWPTGTVYTNQTGGTACLHPELEGAFVPLGNDTTMPEGVLVGLSVQLEALFTGVKYVGAGALAGLDSQVADAIDRLLAELGYSGCIEVNRSKLHHSHEAWVHIVLLADDPSRDAGLFSGFGPYPRGGVLTWANSD
jgi:hypothetical protein